MSSDNVVRIAVASDLHAHNGSSASPSHLDTNAPETMVTDHPIAGLEHLIRQEDLTAELLLCPGDLGHQADATAIKYAWGALQKVGERMKVKLTTATAGNHDLDSRYKGDDHAPDHILKGLSPAYPLNEEILDDRYWARAVVIKDFEKFRLVLLNSSAYHGHTPIEKNFGRVDAHTLEYLRRNLTVLGRKEVNILLCHHHPQQHSELGLGEGDLMKNGQQLLDLLGSGRHGSWMVIHGHKHHPKLSYAAGTANSPVVFAAGSLCSTLFLPVQTAARNQFYLVEIHAERLQDLGLVGRIRAWDWHVGSGWIPAEERSGIPSDCGFGARTAPSFLARKIAEAVKATSGREMTWADILKQFPDVEYMLPQDFRNTFEELEHTFGLGRDIRAGRIQTIGELI